MSGPIEADTQVTETASHSSVPVQQAGSMSGLCGFSTGNLEQPRR